MDQRKNFPKEEYDSRISKLQSLMAAQDLEGILMSQAENLIYFSGYRTSLYNSKFRPFFCFVPVEGSPTLVLPILELGLGRQTSYIEDFRCWGNLPGCQGAEPLSLIAEVIREKGKEKSKIGIELDNGQRFGMNTAQFEELKDLLPKVYFTSSAEAVWKLRSIKSPQEIEYMREACRITDKAVEAAINFVEEGKTEKEMAKILGITMLEEGADMPRSLNVSSGIGSYDVLNGLGTAREFQAGDMINFDFGTYYKGYCSDITRSIFVGEPSARQRDFYEAIKHIQEKTCNAVKPGIPISEIDQVAEQAIIDSGYR